MLPGCGAASSRRLGKAGLGYWVSSQFHHGLDALDILISDVVLGTELRRDVDMGNVVAGRRVDAVERLEEHPVLPQPGGDFVQAGLGGADKAVGEPALVVARVGVIEPRVAFQDGPRRPRVPCCASATASIALRTAAPSRRARPPLRGPSRLPAARCTQSAMVLFT